VENIWTEERGNGRMMGKAAYEEPHNMYSLLYIITMIKLRVRWTKYIACMGDKRNA
jgi:hypothetical protein